MKHFPEAPDAPTPYTFCYLFDKHHNYDCFLKDSLVYLMEVGPQTSYISGFWLLLLLFSSLISEAINF